MIFAISHHDLIVIYRKKYNNNSIISMQHILILYFSIQQRCRRCTFDSPGLTSESEVYPGLFAVSGNNAIGVVPFIPRHFIAAFHAEKAQHLRR